MKDFRVGEFYCRVSRCKSWDGFYAWGARVPELGEDPLGVAFDKECWFHSEDTEESAVSKLTDELTKLLQ